LKLLNGILLAGAALIGYNLISKHFAAGTLNFLPGQIKSISFPVITVGIVIQNTSNQAYTLKSLAGNVYTNANGSIYNIGNVSNFTAQTINPNSQKTIPIDLRLSLIGVVSDIFNLITSGNFQQDIQLKGFANVDGLQIPLVFNYKLG
jgi:hypothetical protein